MKTLYLNNHGSKWIVTGKGDMDCLLVHKARGYRKVRKAEYFESFGNFAAWVLKYQGKRISCLPDDIDEETGLPICFVDYKEKYV